MIAQDLLIEDSYRARSSQIHIEHPVYQVIEQILIWISVALTIISLMDYLIKNKQVLKEQK